MKLLINGKKADINEDFTIGRLLIRENVKMPEMVSVELNGQIIKRSDFEKTELNDGDKVEFLYFMGGGHGID
jgi:sulfur carrier protein